METAAIIAIAASVVSAGLGVVQGIQSSRAAKLEQSQFEDEAKTARLAADQEEVARRKRLTAILSENQALRGARGLSESGTSRAIEDENIRMAEDDIGIARMNRLGQAQRADYGAFGASMRSRAGLFSGAGAIVSGLGSAAMGLHRYGGKSSAKGSA